MAKVRGPLFSFDASGTVAGLLTFNPTRTTPTARRAPRSSAPPSAAQIVMRQRCRDAAASWHALTAPERAAWTALIASRSHTPFGKYLLEWNAQRATLAQPPLLPIA
jgi:hypothetical protein